MLGPINKANSIENKFADQQKRYYWWVLLAILTVISTTIVSIVWLKEYASKAHTAEALLLTIHSLVNEQNATEWQAIALQDFNLELHGKISSIRSQLVEQITALQQQNSNDSTIKPVIELFAEYQMEIDEEFELLANGDYVRARAVDEEKVDPCFLLLRDSLVQAGQFYQSRAQKVDQIVISSTMIILAIAMMVIVLLIKNFEHMRQASTLMKAEQQILRASEEHFRALVQNALDIIMVSDYSGIIRYISPSSQRILGYTPSSLIGQQSLDLVHTDDMARINRSLAVLATTPGEIFTLEMRIQHYDGAWRFMEATAYNLLQDPNIAGIVFNVHDITERKVAEEQLQYQAFHDPLTGLPNRALFIDRLQQALARTGRQNRPVAILFIDLDNFKIINDSLGHEVGDQLLIYVAQQLMQCVRPSNTIARLGGDEFTILLDDIDDKQTVEEVVACIQCTLKCPFQLNEQAVVVTSSIGIALSTHSFDQPDEIMRAADVAMYQAKALGKAQSIFFEPFMDIQAKERLQLELELRRALEKDEICVYYQPIMNLATSRMIGLEALARWNHPERGIVEPQAFIAIAEETGLIIPIGQRVIELACRQLSQWQKQYPAHLSLQLNINLSARQFRHLSLVSDIERTLQETGLCGHHIEFELTESLLLADDIQTQQAFLRLKALGVQFALDDFGTGYSSLAYLQHFPIDTVKIDRSFINQLGTSRQATSIINAVMSFAQTLNLQVTAEGIETTDQYTSVRNLGCQFGQGYYFTKPLPPEDICHFLSKVK